MANDCVGQWCLRGGSSTTNSADFGDCLQVTVQEGGQSRSWCSFWVYRIRNPEVIWLEFSGETCMETRKLNIKKALDTCREPPGVYSWVLITTCMWGNYSRLEEKPIEMNRQHNPQRWCVLCVSSQSRQNSQYTGHQREYSGEYCLSSEGKLAIG